MEEVFGKYITEDTSGFSVREIKFARARLAVLQAFVEEISRKNYEEIRIKDLCREAEISEPSFYNYFPRKDDLFLYFISLWSVDVQLHCRSLLPGLDTIRELFCYTAEKSGKNPELLKQVIAYQARTNTSEAIKGITPVTLAEKTVVFGRVSGMEQLPDSGMGPVLFNNLSAAIENGELPSTVDAQAFTLILGALFFGVPVIMLHNEPEKLSIYYQHSLDQLFGKKIKNSVTNKKPKKRERK